MMKADVGQAATCLLHLTGSEQSPTLLSQQDREVGTGGLDLIQAQLWE